MTIFRAVAAGLAGLILSLGACAQPAPELIVTAVPPRLRLAEGGLLQVSIASRTAIASAVLSVDAPGGLDVSPDRVTLSRLPAVSDVPAPAAASPPNPPALGLVPMRNFSLKAKEVGEHRVTVTLTFDGHSVSRTVAVVVTRD